MEMFWGACGAGGALYLKYDNCGEVDIQSYAKFSAMSDALNATGVHIVFSYEPHLTVPIQWTQFVVSRRTVYVMAACNSEASLSKSCVGRGMRGGRVMISGEPHKMVPLSIQKTLSRIVIQCGQEPVLVDVFGPRDQQRLGVCRRDWGLERC